MNVRRTSADQPPASPADALDASDKEQTTVHELNGQTHSGPAPENDEPPRTHLWTTRFRRHRCRRSHNAGKHRLHRSDSRLPQSRRSADDPLADEVKAIALAIGRALADDSYRRNSDGNPPA